MLKNYDDPTFLLKFSNSCPLNLLLVRSHQAEMIIIKRLIQACDNVTSRVRVEPKTCDQVCRKNVVSTLSGTDFLNIVVFTQKQK